MLDLRDENPNVVRPAFDPAKVQPLPQVCFSRGTSSYTHVSYMVALKVSLTDVVFSLQQSSHHSGLSGKPKLP